MTTEEIDKELTKLNNGIEATAYVLRLLEKRKIELQKQKLQGRLTDAMCPAMLPKPVIIT